MLGLSPGLSTEEANKIRLSKQLAYPAGTCPPVSETPPDAMRTFGRLVVVCVLVEGSSKKYHFGRQYNNNLIST